MRPTLCSTLFALTMFASPTLCAESLADQINQQAAANDASAAAKDQSAAQSEHTSAQQEQSAINTNKTALHDDQVAAHRDNQAIHADTTAIHEDRSALHTDQSQLAQAKSSGNTVAAAVDQAHIASDEKGLAASQNARSNVEAHEVSDLIGEDNAEHAITTERDQRNRDNIDASRDTAHANGALAAETRADNAVGHDESVGDAEHRDNRSLGREAGADFRAGRAAFHADQAANQKNWAGIHLANGERRKAGSAFRRGEAYGHENAGYHRDHRD